MKVLGFDIEEQQYEVDGKKYLEASYYLFDEKYTKKIELLPKTKMKEVMHQMKDRAKCTIQKVICQQLYKEKVKKGKYLIVSYLYAKKQDNMIPCLYAGKTYAGEDLKFYTNNDLALKLKREAT